MTQKDFGMGYRASKPKEIKTVRFKITPKDLSLWNIDMKFITEPCEFDVMIGCSADDVVLSKRVKYGINENFNQT